MRLEPVRDWVNAIAMLHKRQSGMIELPNSTKNVSRCYLIEAVGPEAKAAGYAPGDIVIAEKVRDLVFYGGAFHRAKFKVDEIIDIVFGASLEEFVALDGKDVMGTIPSHLLVAARERREAHK